MRDWGPAIRRCSSIANDDVQPLTGVGENVIQGREPRRSNRSWGKGAALGFGLFEIEVPARYHVTDMEIRP